MFQQGFHLTGDEIFGEELSRYDPVIDQIV
jgi:hypothetical protein